MIEYARLLQLPDHVSDINDLMIIVPDDLLSEPMVANATEKTFNAWLSNAVDRVMEFSYYREAGVPTRHPLKEVAEGPVRDMVEDILIAAYADNRESQDFSCTLSEPLSIPLRIHIDHPNGYDLLSCRLHKQTPPHLEELLLPLGVYEILSSPILNKGGVAWFVAEPGAGKSTTMIATLLSRLKQFGGEVRTIESPIEMPLPVLHGDNGMCAQYEAHGDAALEKCLENAARQYPSCSPKVLMLGEVSTPRMARAAMNLALNGTFVLATTHGTTIGDGLDRVASMAAVGSGRDFILKSMASTFRLGIHQEMASVPGGEGWKKKRYYMNLTHRLGDKKSGKIQSLIAEGKFSGLDHEATDFLRRIKAVQDRNTGNPAFPSPAIPEHVSAAYSSSSPEYIKHQIGAAAWNDLGEDQKNIRMKEFFNMIGGT